MGRASETIVTLDSSGEGVSMGEPEVAGKLRVSVRSVPKPFRQTFQAYLPSRHLKYTYKHALGLHRKHGACSRSL